MWDIPGVVLASVLDMSETADVSVPVWRLKLVIFRPKMAVSCSVGQIWLGHSWETIIIFDMVIHNLKIS